MRRLFAACALTVLLTTPAYGRPEWVDPVAGMRLTCGFLDPNYTRTLCRADGAPDARDSWRKHLGADFRASSGTQVVAPVTGEVVMVNASATAELAYLVIRDSTTGEEHVLGHVNSTVRSGATVTQGDPVGRIANWGANSHLHWGFNVGRVATAIQKRSPCLRGGVMQDCAWGWGKAPFEATEREIRSQGWRNVL